QKFTVLAKIPAVARARTRFEEATQTLHVSAEGRAPIEARLDEEEGRAAFAAWLTEFLGPMARGPLRVIPAPGAHRFFDHPKGHVSLINLASVRDIKAKIGHSLDPLRFRANFYVDGWPAWAELNAKSVRIGGVGMDVFASIPRCAATHVDPERGVADVDLCAA